MTLKEEIQDYLNRYSKILHHKVINPTIMRQERQNPDDSQKIWVYYSGSTPDADHVWKITQEKILFNFNDIVNS